MRLQTTSDALFITASNCAALGLSLDLRCSCSHSRQVPFRMMVRDHPQLARTPLGRILLRLRCFGRCRRPPVRAVLLDIVEHAAHAGNARSTPLPWQLVLVGE